MLPSWTLCNRWPPPVRSNPNQANYVVVPTTDLYRKFTKIIPSSSSSSSSSSLVVVVEIGCANGYCIEKILKALSNNNNNVSINNQVLGVDVSSKFIATCHERFPTVDFLQANVLMEWNRVQESIQQKVLSLQQSQQQQQQPSQQQSQQQSQPDLYIFCDIGGNREIETLLALLQTIHDRLNPQNLIVKSKALYALGKTHGLDNNNNNNNNSNTRTAGKEETGKGKGEGEGDGDGWNQLKALARTALHQRRQRQPRPQRTTDDDDNNNNNSNNDSDTGNGHQGQTTPTTTTTTTTNHWYHPLKYPQRYNAEGVAICRYHNYDVKRGCLLHSDPHQLQKQQLEGPGENSSSSRRRRCPLDHDHCHSCLQTGHVAWQCPVLQVPLIETLL